MCIEKFRACCVVHSPVGFVVQGETQIRREPTWMKTRKYNSTIPVIVHFFLQAKSHCHMVAACLLRKSDQVSGWSWGSGPKPACTKTFLTVWRETVCPSLRSACTIFVYPQFVSLRMRRIASLILSSTRGRPDLPSFGLARWVGASSMLRTHLRNVE